MKFSHVVLGGTFDQLHAGHRQLLNRAISLGDRITVGLTSDTFVKNKPGASRIQDYPTRLGKLREYLHQHQLTESRFKIIQLNDSFGISVSDPSIDCIVVSQETEATARLINQTRIARGLRAVHVEVVDWVDDQAEEPISSTNIRAGIVNPNGERYDQLFEQTLKLNSEQTAKLKAPMSDLYSSLELVMEKYSPDEFQYILVGDVVTNNADQLDLKSKLVIVDGQSKRKPFDSSLPKADIYSQNQAGLIESGAVNAIKTALSANRSMRLQIEGEEDLLVLPCLLLSPLKSVVVYGQPEQGVVAVEVTTEAKKYWYDFLVSADKIGHD